MIFYYKFINNTLPKPIINILTAQTRTLRAVHTAFFLKPPDMANTEAAKQCIRHSIPTFINEFDKNFIEELPTLSLLSVKNKFKLKTLKSYSTHCEDETCYPCSSTFFNSFGFAFKLKFLHIFFYMINFQYLKLFLCTGILEYINIFNYTNNPH